MDIAGFIIPAPSKKTFHRLEMANKVTCDTESTTQKLWVQGYKTPEHRCSIGPHNSAINKRKGQVSS